MANPLVSILIIPTLRLNVVSIAISPDTKNPPLVALKYPGEKQYALMFLISLLIRICVFKSYD